LSKPEYQKFKDRISSIAAVKMKFFSSK